MTVVDSDLAMSLPPPIRGRQRRSIAEEVADDIRNRIITGKLPPGRPIGQNELAAELDTSTTPVREALLQLAAEGFVRNQPRRAFVVVPFTRKDVEDVFWVHSIIASELCVRSAREAGDALLPALEEAQGSYREAVRDNDSEQMELANWRFHQTMNRGTESGRLRWLLRSLIRLTPSYFIYENYPDWLPRSVKAHDLIVDAIRTGSEVAIRAAVTQHINDARDAFIRHLDENGYWTDRA